MRNPLFILLFGCLVLTSCFGDGDPELSAGAKKYISIRKNGNPLDNTRSVVFSDGLGLGSTSQNVVDGNASDTRSSDHPCPIITRTENPDGSTTVVYDFGDYCLSVSTEDHTLVSFGKITQTQWQNYEENDEGGYRWEGYSSGVWENSGETSTYRGETESQTWNGTASSHTIEEYNWTNPGLYTTTYKVHNLEMEYNGEIFKSLAESSKVETPEEWREPVRTIEYRWGDNFLHAEITETLISYKECSNILDNTATYHAGKEFVTWQIDGEAGELLIDHGLNECDRISLVVEDGNKIPIRDIFK